MFVPRKHSPIFSRILGSGRVTANSEITVYFTVQDTPEDPQHDAAFTHTGTAP